MCIEEEFVVKAEGNGKNFLAKFLSKKIHKNYCIPLKNMYNGKLQYVN